ncbi:unnamed protein product (macronuclear) [Paramecium tetraurelia]|uniref:Oxidation resistance protein 1 n=1 Tax=Paramecium tetraurelia TaxID=5888 RepID=A0C416_PARTE|nr:uncharacterized protein GSPATT00035013001 [Paramecium tetraurelia]CAK65533.1 unnamed protein product [Paramecium tetraurelia]|eukprot:XP_001432930.1 hypothetical protein (macronuclear) [Paramecium tetraurelia strain d4-2]
MFKKVKKVFRFIKPKKQKASNTEDFELKRKTTVLQYDETLKTKFTQESTIDTQKNKEYEEYEVQQEDSLIGIALKFDMSVELLKRINNLSSEFIVQGMVLKVFKQDHEDSAEDEYSEEEEVEQMEQDIWKQQIKQYNNILMYYCMDDQNVKGQMTVREDMILFDSNQVQQQAGKRIMNNACISINDINEAIVHILPNANDQKDYLIQILLSGIGRVEFEKKFRKKLQKFKKQKKSIATIFFRYQERYESGQLIPEEVKRDMCKSITEFINHSVQNLKDQQDVINLTKLPYIDLIDESNHYQQLIQKQELDNVIGKRMGRLWASISYVPKYKANSKCLNESLYKQLIELIPAIYRLSNWSIKFTIDNDGSSYEQLLLSLQYQNPFFFTIKDKDGKVFGAYVSSELQGSKKGFHGTGETFLFQQDELQMIPYYWKETNNDFVYCDSDGFCVGCGPSFGIFVDSKLYFGYNNPCSTFENPRFTQNEKFLIQHFEVWVIEQL